MIIKIEKDEEGYIADLKDLPGSPPVGKGKTPEEAVAALFFVLLSGGMDWIRHINLLQFRIENES